MKNIVFITKDALRKGALPTYSPSNDYFKTPNIDALAKKGTVFNRHYTAGASTAMAFTGMAIEKYCYETERKLYDGKEKSQNGNTIFDYLYNIGYDVNIAWDASYTEFSKTHFKCEGKNTKVHTINNLIPCHSPHVNGEFDDLTFKDNETEKGIQSIKSFFESMEKVDKPLFLWLHLPHVFAGRNAYDSDIDVFDNIIGLARKTFGDDCIYVSADHGQMSGHKGKFGYGFDVEESTICIPLITPKFQNFDKVDFPTSNTQMLEIFGVKPFTKREFVISETAYYVQPKRKISIIHDDFKLVYSKEKKYFELYDLKNDEFEQHNLFYPEFYDVDRKSWYSLNQRFFYPRWQMALKEKDVLIAEFNKLWKVGNFFEELYQKILFRAKFLYSRLTQKKGKKKIINKGK